jgi:hypothetical protein
LLDSFVGTLRGIATTDRMYFPVETLYRVVLKSDGDAENVTTDMARSAGNMVLSVACSARDDVRLESVVERTGAWFGRLGMR